MDHTRRKALQLFGGVATLGLSGCSAPKGGSAVTSTESIPLAVRTGRPGWKDGEEAVGFVALIDSEERGETARSRFGLRGERAEAVEAFVAETDFETERLLLVETVGPDACHDTVAFEDVGLDDGVLSATAEATARDADTCAQVVTYPSALLRASFEGTPADVTEVTVRDGWDRSSVLEGSTTTALEPLDPGAD